MANIKDIAKEAGVSIGTVDRVIHNRGRVSDETRARIEAVLETLNYKPNLVAQGLAVKKKNLHLCFMVMDSARNPFFYDIRTAAEKETAKLKEYGVHVTICILHLDEKNQIRISTEMKYALLQSDGIAAMGHRSPEVQEVLKEASEKGIPIVFYNCRLKNIDYLAFVGCDYVASGKLAAGLVALAGGREARVGIFSEEAVGDEKIESYQERVQGFEQEIAERYPDIQITGMEKIEFDHEKNLQMVKQSLNRNPEINVAYIVNPADYQVCEAIRKADPTQRISIITNDLVGRQIEMVRDGVISATICQEPAKQGAKPLQILFQYLAYGKKPAKKSYYTKLTIHIAQNIY